MLITDDHYLVHSKIMTVQKLRLLLESLDGDLYIRPNDVGNLGIHRVPDDSKIQQPETWESLGFVDFEREAVI